MAERRFGPYTLTTSNEDKVLFPREGITKGEIIDYYLDVAGVMLPHLARRPLAMQRFPDGIAAAGFFQRQVPEHCPDWVERVTVDTAEGPRQRLVCRNRATLAWLAQQACLTPHPWLSRCDHLACPDRLVLDLDPPGDDFAVVREAAVAAHALFEEIGLSSHVMTTGSRGLHVVVVLDRRADFATVRAFAQDFARVLQAHHPQTLTTAQRRQRRGGRLYLDTSSIAYGQASVAPYALRARPRAPVATPLAWHELADARLHAQHWTLRTVRQRLAARGDPWRAIGRGGQGLARARRRLASL